ncbi:MAG: hypothetical protein RDU89_08925 [bacterium]|nr:hypothetical protein [bacterium]
MNSMRTAQHISRPGRYRKLESGLELKEVVTGEDSVTRQRFGGLQPEGGECDRHERADIIAEVKRRLAELELLAGEPHNKAACAIRAHSSYGRYNAGPP